RHAKIVEQERLVLHGCPVGLIPTKKRAEVKLVDEQGRAVPESEISPIQTELAVQEPLNLPIAGPRISRCVQHEVVLHRVPTTRLEPYRPIEVVVHVIPPNRHLVRGTNITHPTALRTPPHRNAGAITTIAATP